MGSGLKSALEIALEKANKMGGDDIPSLGPDEKREIAEIRKVYGAKFAEVEILVQVIMVRNKRFGRRSV